MEAFVIGPANIASKSTTAPIAIPAIIPISLLPVETFIITTIRKNVSSSSKTKARQTSTVAIVAPKFSLAGNRNHKIKLAANAPKICVMIYLGTYLHENFLAYAKAIVTAGLK